MRAAVTVPSDWPAATAVHASPTNVVLEELPSLCSHGSDGNDVGTGVGSVVGLRLGSNVGIGVGVADGSSVGVADGSSDG